MGNRESGRHNLNRQPVGFWSQLEDALIERCSIGNTSIRQDRERCNAGGGLPDISQQQVPRLAARKPDHLSTSHFSRVSRRSRRCSRCRRYRRCQCYSWTVLKKRVVHFMVTETIRCADIPTPVSRIGLGTWAIGGSLLGGSYQTESVSAIQGAVGQGIQVIDIAPVSGYVEIA